MICTRNYQNPKSQEIFCSKFFVYIIINNQLNINKDKSFQRKPQAYRDWPGFRPEYFSYVDLNYFTVLFINQQTVCILNFLASAVVPLNCFLTRLLQDSCMTKKKDSRNVSICKRFAKYKNFILQNILQKKYRIEIDVFRTHGIFLFFLSVADKHL